MSIYVHYINACKVLEVEPTWQDFSSGRIKCVEIKILKIIQMYKNMIDNEVKSKSIMI